MEALRVNGQSHLSFFRQVHHSAECKLRATWPLFGSGGKSGESHLIGDCVRGDVTTNTAEGFFALFKRGRGLTAPPFRDYPEFVRRSRAALWQLGQNCIFGKKWVILSLTYPLDKNYRRPTVTRWKAVLVRYLDDSGEDKEPVVTMAGYLSPEENWKAFELEARPFLDSCGLEYFHAVEMHQRRRQFEGWEPHETREFSRVFYEILEKHVALGFEFSVLKARFAERKKSRHVKREGSPYAFCFKALAERILANEGVAACLNDPKVKISFVVEAGNKNNGDVLARFNHLKKTVPGKFLDMRFEDKESSVALNAADFLAFYARRIRCRNAEFPREGEFEMFSRLTQKITHNYFLAQCS